MNSSKIIVIAGGICSGKSYISNIISDKGYKVFDTDSIAKEFMSPVTNEFKIIVDYFGENILEKGVINKKKLAEIIFNNEEKRKFLEGIIHNSVIYYIKKESRNYSLSFVETAIAKRSGIDKLGKVWYVYASKEDRISRMINERGYSLEYAKKIINAQEDEEKLLYEADEVIQNGKGQEPKEKVLELLRKYETM